jgi:hypothetical protein
VNHGAHPLGDDYPPREEAVKRYDSSGIIFPASLQSLVRRALSFDLSERVSMRDLVEGVAEVRRG